MTRGRVVIGGGGVAGLLAAAAAVGEFDDIVIAESGGRRGERAAHHPQRGQHHNILTRGQLHLEEMFPGFRAALLAAGGVEGEVTTDTHVYEFGGVGAERPLGLSIWSAPWQAIWDVARSLLPPSVTFRSGMALDALVLEKGALRAVRVRSRAGSAPIEVDAVVDATGYGSESERLLRNAGAAVPLATEQRLDRWVVTLRLRRPSEWIGTTEFWMAFTEPPDRHLALLSPYRSDEWILSVSSQETSRRPPRDLTSVLDFLDTLPGPPLRPVLEHAALIGQPSFFSRRMARWWHYETLDAPLPGFAAIGDAFASINFVFGQGIGVAAWHASVLREALRTESGPVAWTRRYLDEAGAIVAQAWALTEVPVPLISLRDWNALARSLAHDVELHRRYVGLWHLVEPASSLPELVEQARAGLGRRSDSPG